MDNNLILRNNTPDLTNQGQVDTLPPADRGDITNLDEDKLRSYIYSAWSNCIIDKQDYGWLTKKEYNIKAYYGIKNEAMKHYPHENASAFPVPLTPTLVDTAWSNVQAGLFSNPNTPLMGEGVGTEDIRPQSILLKYLNWQMVKEIGIEQESDKNVFRSFLHGDGVFKTIFDLKTNKVKVRSIDIENFFVPLDATGVQKGDTDIIIHIIPLSYADVQLRKAMKIYRKPEAILPGANLILKDTDQIRRQVDDVSGQSMDTKINRDNFYIAEIDCYGYVPPDAYKPIDLKVWMSPDGATIQRIRKLDPSLKSPYSVVHCYPYADRFYSMGIPEKVQNEQEKIDYSDKQYTDALDIASMPAMFVDDTDTFQRGRMQRVRGGIYPKGKGNTIDWEPQPPIDRGFMQERMLIWEMAIKKCGLPNTTFGGATERDEPLGTTQIREARSDIRFSTIFKRFGKQIEDTAQIVYELNYLYTPRQKIVDVIGYSAEGYSINELFPVKDGKLAEHNFRFSGYLKSDKEYENRQKLLFLDSQMTSPIVAQDSGNTWNVSKEMAEINGIRDFSKIVRRPKETRIIEVDEFIQRVISGDTNVQVRPGIDAEDYVFELNLFKRSPMYRNLEPFQRQLLEDALRRSEMIAMAEKDERMMMSGLMNLRDRVMQIQSQGQEVPEEVPQGIPNE